MSEISSVNTNHISQIYPNGIPKEIGKYLGGEKHGRWKEYNPMGDRIKEIEYKNGLI